MRPVEKGSRAAGCSVSGRRSAAQASTHAPKQLSAPNTHRHGPNSMMTCPMEGARIGTARNTMKASDITRAMSRPLKRSRTIDTASTRVAAAPTPIRARAASRVTKEVDSDASNAKAA